MTTTEPSTDTRHAYVHLPFCARRCPYCDFNAHAGRDDDMDAYADALLQEARERLPGTGLETLYVGGGTPTYGAAPRIARVLAGLREAAGEPIDELTVTPFTYVPFAPDGLFRIMASARASKFSSKRPESKLTLPIGA